MADSKLLKRVLKKAGNERLIENLTSQLTHSEMTTLLMGLTKEMTKQTSPAELISRFSTNRFCKPSDLDPLKVKEVELSMLGLSKIHGFSPILLSPAAILGSCSVIGKVDQNNVISASRGVELLSDSTNMLAIHIANLLKSGELDNRSNAVHLSASNRVARSQLFDIEGFVPHFGLLALVSSGKDSGSYSFEKTALTKHINYYLDYFVGTLGHSAKIVLNTRAGYKDPMGLMDRIHSHLAQLHPDIEFSLNREGSDNTYYQGINFKILINETEIVDGGFVDWSQKMLGNKKERMLISGTGIDLQIVMGMVP